MSLKKKSEKISNVAAGSESFSAQIIMNNKNLDMGVPIKTIINFQTSSRIQSGDAVMSVIAVTPSHVGGRRSSPNLFLFACQCSGTAEY
jgi:hypothetical protein